MMRIATLGLVAMMGSMGCSVGAPPSPPGNYTPDPTATVTNITATATGNTNWASRAASPALAASSGGAVDVLLASYFTDDAVPATPTARFSLAATSDIVAYIYFTMAPGVHVAWVQLTTPEGGVYERQPIAFAIGPTEVQFVQVDGVVAPLQVVPATETALGWRVEKLVPVSGTPIAKDHLVGAWQLSVACEKSITDVVTFTITD